MKMPKIPKLFEDKDKSKSETKDQAAPKTEPVTPSTSPSPQETPKSPPPTPETKPPEKKAQKYTAYDLKAKQVVDVQDPKIVVMKNNALAVTGKSQVSGMTLYRILTKEEIAALNESEAAPPIVPQTAPVRDPNDWQPPITKKVISPIQVSPSSFWESTVKQEIHHIVCLNIGGRLRWVHHYYPKNTESQFVHEGHTFGIDTRQIPLMEDEKARPIYLSIVGSYSPALIKGLLEQKLPSKPNDPRPPASTDKFEIMEYENQETDVFNRAFDQKEAESVLQAGTKNQLQPAQPVWMQFLAFGGIPLGFILGILVAPYIAHAFGG